MQATLPTLLTLDQASIILNLSPSVILEHTEAGNIPGQKIGDTWHVYVADSNDTTPYSTKRSQVEN